MKKNNKNIISIISGMALVAVSAIPAMAEIGVDANIKAAARPFASSTEARMELRTETKTERSAMKGDLKTRFDEMRVEVKAMQEAGASESEIKAKLEEARKANQADREKFRALLEEKRKTLKDDFKKEIDAFKEGKKIKLDEAAKAKVKQRLNGAFGKLDGAVAKMMSFDKKLSEEITRRKALGLNTAEAEVNLELARRSLEETKISLEAVDAAVALSLDSTTGASKEAIKAVINTALQSVKTTKSKYKEVLGSLPKIEAEANVNVEASVK